MEKDYATPILFPVQLEIFWSHMRQLIREEIRLELKKNSPPGDEPLLTRQEIAAFLKISLVTLHDWMKNLDGNEFKSQPFSSSSFNLVPR